MESEIKTQTPFYTHTITETVDNKIYINKYITEFTSIDETKEFLKNRMIEEKIQSDVEKELYEEISYTKIANIIKEHNENIRISDTLIESYLDLASSKTFTVDPIVHEISKLNNFDKLIENRLDFILKDNTKVVIKEETFNRINNIFRDHPDIINYMNSNINNFLYVVDKIEEQNAI
jgi:hypothetical protein